MAAGQESQLWNDELRNSSCKQLLQLRFELEVIPALLLFIGHLLWITGLLGPVYFV